MKCPICKTNISELDEVCPNCKTNFDEYEKEKQFTQNKCNADKLSAMANINIILSIIGTITIWLNFGTTEVLRKSTYFSSGYTERVINWYGIIGGIAILISGLTLFFLLRTVVDIYWKVGK